MWVDTQISNNHRTMWEKQVVFDHPYCTTPICVNILPLHDMNPIFLQPLHATVRKWLKTYFFRNLVICTKSSAWDWLLFQYWYWCTYVPCKYLELFSLDILFHLINFSIFCFLHLWLNFYLFFRAMKITQRTCRKQNWC